jgi:hypothetical protein
MGLVAIALALGACRGDPVYDFGFVATGPAPGGATALALDVGRFVSRLYADVLGRRPGALPLSIDCDAFEAVIPGFKASTCGGRSTLDFTLDERDLFETALGAVADPAALWPHLIGVFLEGSGVTVASPADIRGHEGDHVDTTFRRYLDRDPTAYERFALTRALREDPAMTPRALLLGVLSSEEYRSR